VTLELARALDDRSGSGRTRSPWRGPAELTARAAVDQSRIANASSRLTTCDTTRANIERRREQGNLMF
jgi:hypothetical protein